MWTSGERAGWQSGKRAGALAVATLLTAAAACGGGGENEPRTEDTTDERLTPMEEFFGDEGTGGGQDSTEWRRQMDQLDELVAECMRAQGFEYTLVADQVAGETVVEDGEVIKGGENVDESDLLPEDEYVATYGYGISTIDAFGDGVRIRPDIGNLEGLSPAEQAAYDLALRGDWTGYDEWVNGEISDEEMIFGAPAEAGCYGESIPQVFTDRSTTEDDLAEQFPSLVAQSGAVEARIASDPRAVQALTDWSDCVADAGHPGLNSPEEAQESIRGRKAGLGDDPASLEALRADEVSLALADQDCQAKVELDQVLWDVQVDHEQKFIDDNREELENYRDALAAARGDG